MSTPDFEKRPGGQPGGPADPFAPADAYGPPPGAPTGYGTPGGYGSPPPYGSPSPYGSPYGTPYGSPAGGVEGPGGEWLGPPLASWGRRVGGAVVDGVLASVVAGVLSAVDPSLGTLAQIAFLLLFGYLTGTTGQTPGRTLLGIKVVRVQDGQVCGVGSGIARQFLHILDALPLGLGFLWPLWDKKNQTFTDKILKTVVLKV